MKLFFLLFTLCFAFQLSAQSQDPAALRQEIAALENLMSRTDPTHAEYQKAAALRDDLLLQLNQSMPDGRFSPYSSVDMQQYIGLLQDITALFDDRANNNYAIQYAALLEKRPKFASLLDEQAVMVLQLDPAKYDIWKRFQAIHPNYHN